MRGKSTGPQVSLLAGTTGRATRTEEAKRHAVRGANYTRRPIRAHVSLSTPGRKGSEAQFLLRTPPKSFCVSIRNLVAMNPDQHLPTAPIHPCTMPLVQTPAEMHCCRCMSCSSCGTTKASRGDRGVARRGRGQANHHQSKACRRPNERPAPVDAQPAWPHCTPIRAC